MNSDDTNAGELAQLRAEVARLRTENGELRARNERLCLSDLRLRRLLDSEIIGVLIGAANGEILEVNPVFERIIGRSGAQLNLSHWQSYVAPKEEKIHREKGELLWTSGSCAAWETEFLRPDGSCVPVITGATLIDAAQCESFDRVGNRENQICGGNDGDTRTMLMWALDISERKKIEDELRASENQMRAIVENLHDGLLLTDLDDTITYANARISEISGYSNAELIGQNAMRILTDPENWPACSHRNQTRAQGQSGTYEVALRHRDGSTRWMLINGSPLRNANGEIIGTIGAHFDITERKKDENERAHFAKKLENSNRDLETFAFAVSHDLKQPLRKIEVFCGRLQDEEGEKLSPQGRHYLERTRRAAHRMTGLINGLLAYSRVATLETAPQIVDLNRVMSEVALDLELAIERADATLEVGPLPTLRADATQMHQLLQNLIGNALAYRRPDVPLVVRVSGRVERDSYEIEVADNGRGFTVQQAEAVFEIFRRLDNDYCEGAGVGLTICRAIVERHGGTLTAHGVPDQGAVFRVRLPFDGETSGRDSLAD